MSATPTRWRCEQCGSAGQVEVPEGASFYDGLDLVRSAHTAAAHECSWDWDLSYVRLDMDNGSEADQ